MEEEKIKVELWRDLIMISILLGYALIISLVNFLIFEGVGYFALLSLIPLLFMFGYVFHVYLRCREEFYS